MRKAFLLADAALSKGLRPFLRTIPHTKKISPSFFRLLSRKMKGIYGDDKCNFIKSSQLSAFLNRVPHNFSSVVLLGDSDHDLTHEEYCLLNSFDRAVFFVQNLNFQESSRVKLLPLGVEDLRWAKNGLPWNFRRKFRSTDRKSLGILAGPFGSTHQVRNEVLRTLGSRSSKDLHIYLDRFASWQYSILSSRYKYVVCPRGNGLDTHRFWETLYRGSIPIVIRSGWSDTLERYQVPLLAINAWDELDDQAIHRSWESNTRVVDFIRTSWWEKRLHETIQEIAKS